MTPPQLPVAGIDSRGPLQLAVFDVRLQLASPLACPVEDRELVLDLYEGKPCDALLEKLGGHVLELGDERVEQGGAFPQGIRRFGGTQVVHEHETRDELGVLMLGLAQQIAQGPEQRLASGLPELVNGSLRPPAFLRSLRLDNPAIALEHIDRVM